MAKILILANYDVGLYKFRKELIEELLKNNEVYISLPNGDFIPLLKKLGCKYIETPISRRGTNPITDLKLFFKYKNIIKTVGPDVVLTYTIKPNIYGGIACRLAKIPYISNITGLGTAVENAGFMQETTLNLYKSAIKKSRCVFFQNEENKNFFEKKIGTGNYKLIPGSGVNLENFTPLDYPTDEVINFLFVARIMKEKGIEEYLTTAEYIKNKYQNTVFHVLGLCEDNYEEKLKDMEQKNIIKYHGLQKDVKKYYKISHCTIHPTYYPEGMSNVLLESAACARPIITTDRSGCREIIDNGINGFIVDQRNSKDLVAIVEKFISLSHKEKKEMGIAGREKVKNEFDRKIVIEAYLNEINEVLQ